MAEFINQNCIPFHSLLDVNFGRQIIYTNQPKIDESNIVSELYRVLGTHNQNAIEIDYLDKYYRGNQEILYKIKKNRPEVNNKVVINIAHYIVAMHTSEIVGEPIQYVLHGDDQNKALEINELNLMMNGEDKEYFDTELCRWRSICGTGYRYIKQNKNPNEKIFDDTPFEITTESPIDTFICYYASNHKPAFSCQIRADVDNKTIYNVFTDTQFFVIKDKKIVTAANNGNLIIPVIEYPNNSRRLGDIELTIELTDEINKVVSTRADGIEQYVNAWIKFINCDIDIEKFRELRAEGFFKVNSNEGSENKADVEVMTSELNQTETQVAVDDLFEKLLIVQGLANREGNTGGDTGSAVSLRNGHVDSEKMALIKEPIFKRAERQALRVILHILHITNGFKLLPRDIDIKITRSKLDNMLTKAEVLKLLLDCGIDYARAIKTVELFPDPEQVATESHERMVKVFESDFAEQTTVTEVTADNGADIEK